MSQLSRVWLLLILAVSLVGCKSLDRKMASWMDHHQSELIAGWGPPDEIIDDGRGGKIFVYTVSRSFTLPGQAATTVTGSAYSSGSYSYGTATSNTTYIPPQTTSYTAYRMFWIDQQGRVYRWAWRGR